MIKRLRIKFVVINMTIVTLLLSVILGLTYYFTQAKMEMQSVQMMQSITAAPYRVRAAIETDEEIRLPFFAIRLSPHGERISSWGGYYDISGETMDKLIRESCRTDQRIGEIPKYNLRYCRVEGPHSQYLVFADISSEIQTLESLLHTCLLIGVLGFAGFLAASILLSSWAIRPVDRAFRQQRQFVADASHELKTPLTVIMTNAQLMSDYPESGELKEKSLGNILSMSRQMQYLIEQMLNLARSEHRETVISSPVDLSRIIEKAVLPFEPVFFEQGLTLETKVEDHIRVRGNGDQLRQVLEIFLDNARKYTTPGGKTWVTLEKQGKHKCRLTVADEGEEIPQEELEKTFQRFYCLDPSRNRKDSFGLGLAIAKGIAENHKGKLWAESKDGINSYHMELRTVP